MKLTILNTYDTGGAANACVRLHEGLLEIKVDSNLLVLEKKKSIAKTQLYQKGCFHLRKWMEYFQKRLYTKKIHQFRLAYPDISAFTFPETPYRTDLHSLIQNADIINLHWVSGFLDYPSFFQNCKQPIVWTLHDMQAFTGGYHYEADFPMERFEQLLKKQLAVKKQSLKNKELTIVCPSKWLLEKSKSSELFGSFNHHLIPYGIDTDCFYPYDKKTVREELNISIDQKVVLFVATGISIQRKGFHFLLGALPYLKEAVTIYAVGNKQEALEKEQIIQIGKINEQRTMAKWYAAADLFVIPSTADNLPNTVIESIACGTPVVGFPIGGIPDMVKNGLNGFLCEEISSENLAITIEKALEYPFSQLAIREDAVKRFDQKVQASAYLKLFKELVENHK